FRAPSRSVATSSSGGALPPLSPPPRHSPLVSSLSHPSLSPPSGHPSRSIVTRAIPEKSAYFKEYKSVPPLKPVPSLISGPPGTRPEPPNRSISDIEWFWFKPAQKYVDALNLSKRRIYAEPLPRFHFTEDHLRNSNLPFGTELVARRV
ncbi:hypothetical protein PENTCL1PPCAC_2997, partial [Pristionchus entomophagus]